MITKKNIGNWAFWAVLLLFAAGLNPHLGRVGVCTMVVFVALTLLVLLGHLGHYLGAHQKLLGDQAAAGLREATAASFEEGKHLPEWADWLCYLALFGLLLANTHFLLLVAWFFVAFVDLSNRRFKRVSGRR